MVLDQEFIREFASGFEALRDHIRKISWDFIEEHSGISQKDICEVASLLDCDTPFISCWAMGMTQHRNAVASIQQIVNLHLLLGALGKEGAGLCPVRGHSNVQGDRTMGIWGKPPESFLKSLEMEFGFKVPREHGHDTVSAIKAMYTDKAKVFVALGGNFLSASPDTQYTAEALRKCNLTVQISTKLNRSHVVTGRQALILPCLVRSERDIQTGGEQFVTVENSMGIVHKTQGHLRPISSLVRSESSIISGIAKATLGEKVPPLGIDYLQIIVLFEIASKKSFLDLKTSIVEFFNLAVFTFLMLSSRGPSMLRVGVPHLSLPSLSLYIWRMIQLILPDLSKSRSVQYYHLWSA